jgi:hypothetical protein
MKYLSLDTRISQHNPNFQYFITINVNQGNVNLKSFSAPVFSKTDPCL